LGLNQTKITDTLHEDLHAFPGAYRAEIAKYLLARKSFRTNIVQRNEARFKILSRVGVTTDGVWIGEQIY
jgi:hypothetical protein